MQLQPSVGTRMRCSCLSLKELLAKNHSGTNLVEIPTVVIVIFLFLCFVLFFASWNAKIAQKIETASCKDHSDIKLA